MGGTCQEKGQVAAKTLRVRLRHCGPGNALMVGARQLKMRLLSSGTEAATSADSVEAVHILAIQITAQQFGSLSPASIILTKICNDWHDMWTVLELLERRKKPTFRSRRIFQDPGDALRVKPVNNSYG